MTGSQSRDLEAVPLSRHHDRAAFSCGIDTLDRYLQAQALQDAKRHVAAPFVAVRTGQSEIMGFYTLSMTSIDLEDLPETVVKKLPHYPKVPAVLLGRLAVDQKFHRTGVGQFLLMDALARSLRSPVAWVVLVVDAKDRQVSMFYARYGLIPLPDQPTRLFIHHATVTKAFA